jgi:hypothetical protein
MFCRCCYCFCCCWRRRRHCRRRPLVVVPVPFCSVPLFRAVVGRCQCANRRSSLALVCVCRVSPCGVVPCEKSTVAVIVFCSSFSARRFLLVARPPILGLLVVRNLVKTFRRSSCLRLRRVSTAGCTSMATPALFGRAPGVTQSTTAHRGLVGLVQSADCSPTHHVIPVSREVPAATPATRAFPSHPKKKKKVREDNHVPVVLRAVTLGDHGIGDVADLRMVLEVASVCGGDGKFKRVNAEADGGSGWLVGPERRKRLPGKRAGRGW